LNNFNAKQNAETIGEEISQGETLFWSIWMERILYSFLCSKV